MRVRYIPGWRLSLLAVTLLVGSGGAYHRTPLDVPADTNAPALLSTNALPLQKLGPDVYGLGLVQLNRKTRAITFPAVVNMSEGLVEYALVHSSGKVHESVLKTEADPLHIHLARLLLQPAQTNRPAATAPSAAADVRIPRELRGPEVRLWVSWPGEDGRRVALEDLVTNVLTKAKMSPGPWIYSGSRVVEGTFLAQRDGSLVAIIADPDALMNNPRPGRNDDEIWKVNRDLCPPIGTAVQITLE
jgi:hypothetical protein